MVEEVDAYTGEEALAIKTDKCKNIYLVGEVDKMKIPLLNKVLMSLPRGKRLSKS